MEIGVRVVNLGNRGGRVVRRFPTKSYPVFARHYISLCYACSSGHVEVNDAIEMFLALGYSPTQSDSLAIYHCIVAPKRRKEVSHD